MTAANLGRQNSQRGNLEFGSETFDFSLSFSHRQRLSIAVEPNGHVVVYAPVETSVDSVLGVLRKKAGWIIRQRDAFASFGPAMPPKRYVNGETHRYLGRQYRLRVRRGASDSVRLIGRYFEVESKSRDSATTKRLLEAWFRHRANTVFTQRLEVCVCTAYFRKQSSPKWRLRKMRRRWGSCSKDGIILLNPLLVHAPTGCIDYVLVHELCHLVHHSHDAAFYRLLNRVMFDWPKWKERLERFAW